jgi:hypothetical protein
MFRFQIVVVALILPLLQGCAQKVIYKLGDIASSPNQSLRGVSLSIEPIKDIRSSVPENTILFNKDREVKLEDPYHQDSKFYGKHVYINSEQEYDVPNKTSISSQVQNIMVEHGNKRDAFRAVFANSKQNADYYLTGELKRFYGLQKTSAGAKAGAVFGLVGALATANLKTEGEIWIAFSNVKIFAKDGRLIKDIGEVEEKYIGKLPVDAGGFSIFSNVNQRLKFVVGNLYDQVENAIAAYRSQK